MAVVLIFSMSSPLASDARQIMLSPNSSFDSSCVSITKERSNIRHYGQISPYLGHAIDCHLETGHCRVCMLGIAHLISYASCIYPDRVMLVAIRLETIINNSMIGDVGVGE